MRRVANQVECSECAVRNCWEQWTREGTHARKTGSGATRKTTRREDRRIMRTDDNRVRVWGHPDERYNSLRNVPRHTARTPGVMTLSWPARSPDLSAVEHVWEQLKRQMPSCHSVHDLELAVQDLWVHLPQENIRCLINSKLDRVAACIAAGGGPRRF
ncbi:uncharacterized protein TNCV_4727651 [Trichonephila clavipes]|nr:uncharacterized protein TNCV_4727651 [Trichonephila clavipes]